MFLFDNINQVGKRQVSSQSGGKLMQDSCRYLVNTVMFRTEIKLCKYYWVTKREKYVIQKRG